MIKDLTPWVLPEKLAVLNTPKGTPPNQDISTVLPNRPSSDQKMNTSSSVKTASQHKRSKKWLWIAVVGALLVLVVCIAGGIVGLKLWERDIDNQLANRESTTQNTATASQQPEEAQQTTPDVGSTSEEEEEPAQEIQEENAEPNPTLAPTETPQPSPTHSLSPTATNTMTPTETLLLTPAGGEEEQIALGSGVSITPQSGSTGLDVYLYRADGSAITGKYVAVYTPKNDLSGNWVTDQRVCYGYTDNAGRVQCDLVAGRFIATADFSGYNWGRASDKYGEADIEVTPGQRTQMVLRLGRLRMGFVYGDGRVVDGKYVAAFTQRKNISDDWVTENRVGYGYTDNTGEMVFDLTPGNYMAACDFSGYNWGDAVSTMGEANIPVKPGETTQLVIHLSQLMVAVKDANGDPVSNKYVGIYFQASDANENPTAGDRIASAYTQTTPVQLPSISPRVSTPSSTTTSIITISN